MKKILLASLILSSLAYAEAINLGETSVVSTTGFETEILSENKNIEIIGKETLEKKEYRNVEEVLKENSTINIQNTYFGPVVDIRGNGERALSRVKVLIDGIAINPLDESMGTLPINTIPVNSIERIEILPGGGAVLNGSGTAGGVVNIITKLDSKENYFVLDQSNFSYETNKSSISGGYNLTENLYGNIDYSYENGNGYRNRDESFSGALNTGMIYKFNDKNSIKVTAKKFKGQDKTSTATSKELLVENRKADGFQVDSIMDRESYSAEYRFKATSNLEFLATAYTQKFTRDFIEKSIMDEYRMSVGSSFLIGRDVPAQMLGTFNEKTDGIKLKSQYKYENGKIVLGYDYGKTRLKRNSFISFSETPFYHSMMPGRPIMATGEIDIFNDVEKETNAGYLLSVHNINEKTTLTSGVRYEHSSSGGDRSSHTKINNSIRPVNTLSNAEPTKNIEENFAGELGLSYKYSDTGTVYGRYERGFISPLPGQLTDKQGTKYVSNNLTSETSNNFEVGFRDYVYDTLVSGAFYTTFTHDEITLEQSNNHNPATKEWKYYNLDETRRVGLELGLEHNIGKFTLRESFNYVDAEITKGNYKGDKVPMVPKYRINVSGDYAVTDALIVGLTFNYLGESTVREFDKNDNSFKTNISGYHFTDLSAKYSINETLQIKAGINNLFNNKYNYTETRESAIPAPERNYYLGATLKF